MALHEIVGWPASVDAPAMLVTLEGWIDAGFAAAGAMAHLRASTDSTVVARFDGDELLDHRSRRPVMHLVEGVNTGLTWPTIELRHGRDLDGRDVLLLTGPEPDLRWSAFVTEVVQLALRLGVRIVVPLGSYPVPLPHTRAGRIATSASTPELAARAGTVHGTLDVPAGVHAVLERAFADAGVPVVGLWAQVPHYAAAMAYPAASAEVVDAAAAIAGLRLDVTALREAGRLLRGRLDELVAANDEHSAMVRALEQSYDAEVVGSPPSPLLASGEELAAEIERFLREQGS